jgi:hypothetical protein
MRGMKNSVDFNLKASTSLENSVLPLLLPAGWHQSQDSTRLMPLSPDPEEAVEEEEVY